MGSVEDNESQINSMNNINVYSKAPKGPNEIRKESLLTWFKDIFCPNFKFTSIIFILTCIDIIMYIITICFGIKRSPDELLAPTYQTLDLFGMKNNPKIYQGQIHRLILFGILHANLVHLIANMFSQIILGFVIEDLIGTKSTFILYILTNIFGGLFSSVCNTAPGVGASVAIFGILGGYFGFSVMNWGKLRNNVNFLINMMFLTIIVLANATFSVGNEMIDNYGHCGGFIYGFLTIFFIYEPKDDTSDLLWIGYDKVKKLFFGLICLSVILLALIFWVFQSH